MFTSLLTKLHNFIDDFIPSPVALAQREALALQGACCSLLMEVARLDSKNTAKKHKVVERVMRELFGLPADTFASMIQDVARPENRLTSYFKPVVLINKRFEAARKAQFIEQLWSVAMVDGNIDMYEDHLVRKLADLLYVPHSDFILAKNRVQAGVDAQAN
jgi:uncharacterized tellurite resistance protein B-like protein